MGMGTVKKKTRKCRDCKKEYKPRFQSGVLKSARCNKCLILVNRKKREQAKLRKIQSTQKKKERKLKSKKYQESLRKITHAKAWKLMREYAWRHYFGDSEYGNCYTCGKTIDKSGHLSHFHHGTLDFDLRNLKYCCNGCNTYKNGNLNVYGTKLAKELGVKGMEQLMLDAKNDICRLEDLYNIINRLDEYGR